MRFMPAIGATALRIACAIGTALGLTGAASAQPYYYETSFVAQNATNGEDVATISVMESGIPPNTALTPLFIDYTGATAARNVDAAALDACFSLRPPHVVFPSIPNVWGPIYPSGHLAVAKSGGTLPPAIDIYAVWNAILSWENVQNTWADLPDGSHVTRPQTPLWSIPTLSGNPVMAMGIANGFVSAARWPPVFRTDYLITAENVGGFVGVCAYGLTDVLGALSQPAPVTWKVFNGQGGTRPLPGTVVGMAIANGTLPTTTSVERVVNDIVLVVRDPATQDIFVHSVRFDMRNATLGSLDFTAYNSNGRRVNITNMTPQNNPSRNFQGISIARNLGTKLTTLTTQTYSHDLAISMANGTQPTTQNGVVIVCQPTSPNPTWNTFNWGGGPICHIPGSDYNVATSLYTGVAFQALGGPPQNPQFNPFGWYIVNPGGFGAGFDTISAMDVLGNRGTGPQGFFYQYVPNAVPGPIMSHPGGLTKVGNPNLTSGVLTIPYFDQSAYWFDTVAGTGQGGPAANLVPYQVGAGNHTPTPPGAPANLPKANQWWAASNLVTALSYLSEHGLYIKGY